MAEKYLTLEQNTCAARIFLNTFGLTLENTDDINEYSKIKIFDKNTNEVGKLHFTNDKVIMSANYNNSMLHASFDIATVWAIVDIENKDELFGQWSNKIIFELKKQNGIKLSGEWEIASTADSEYGITCFCRPLIKCEVPNKGSIALKMSWNNKLFELKTTSFDYNETINIMPWDNNNGFIRHIITKGEYANERYEHEYKKYMGIFPAGKRNEDKLHIFLNETERNKQIHLLNEFIPKNDDDNSEELVIQKGMLMQDLDPDMFTTIKELRQLLLIGDISLLDNLVSVCYDRYTDKQLKALLGLNRKKMNYQDGSDSLINSYFGIGKSSCFIPIEEQKKFLKK